MASLEIQVARATVTQARQNMDTRLQSSKRLVTACEHFDLNQDYFDKSEEKIRNLIGRTAALSKAIDTLDQANIDIGTCKITVPGRVWGVNKIEKPVAEVNQEIESNLGQKVVQTCLRTLGIIEGPKAPIFTMPERPANDTLVKAGVGTAAVLGLGGAAYAFSDKILPYGGFYMPSMPSMPSMPYFGMPSMPYIGMPSLSSLSDITGFFSRQMSNASYFGSYAGGAISDFASNHYIAIGVGAAVTAIGAAAIYQAVQNSKKEQAQQEVAQV